MRFGYLILIVILLFLSGHVEAGEFSYTCEIIRVYDLSENGTLKTSGFEKHFKRSSFSVSRVTGQIIGEVVTTELAESIWVVNRGSTENSFKAVANFGKQFQILEVQEFRSIPKKPFVVMSMGGSGIITGFCK